MGDESLSHCLREFQLKKKKWLETHSTHSQQTAQEKNPPLHMQEKHGWKEKWMQV